MKATLIRKYEAILIKLEHWPNKQASKLQLSMQWPTKETYSTKLHHYFDIIPIQNSNFLHLQPTTLWTRCVRLWAEFIMTQCGANHRQSLKLHKLWCTVLDLAGSILNQMSFSLLSTGIIPVILMNGVMQCKRMWV